MRCDTRHLLDLAKRVTTVESFRSCAESISAISGLMLMLYCFLPWSGEMRTRDHIMFRASSADHAGGNIGFPDRRRLHMSFLPDGIVTQAFHQRRHLRVMSNMTPSRSVMVVLVPSTSSTSIPRFSASFSTSASMTLARDT